MRSPRPIATHPEPSAARSRAADRFLGAELSPADPPTDTPWLVKAVLSGAPRLEIGGDGVIAARRSGVLPLRHGLSGTGAPATCLLDVAGVARLRACPAAAEVEVECAACRAWQASHGIAPRHTSAPVLSRLRAALAELSPTPKRAA